MNSTERPGFFRSLAIFLGLIVLILLPPEAAVNITEHPRLTVLWVLMYLGFFALAIGWGRKLYLRYDRIAHRPQNFLQHAGTIAGGYLAILIGGGLLSNLNRVINHQTQTANNQAILNTMHSSTLVEMLICFSAVCLTPFAEELIFRGVFMNLFFSERLYWLPIVSSGLVFTLAHASTNLISYLIYFYMGCVFAYVYRSTGNLSNSIGIHMLNNLISMMILLQS